MKTVLTLSLVLSATLIASANLIEQWNFAGEGNFSSLTTYNYDQDSETPNTPRHIGGTTITGSGYEGWDYRAADGAANTTASRAVAAGSTRFAMSTLNRASVNNQGATNAFYGAQNFSGVPWANAVIGGVQNNGNLAELPANHETSGEYYVAAAAQGETITLTMKLTDMDFSQTTGNSNNNGNFGFRLFDRATGFNANGSHANNFIGLTVMDTYNNDRLQLALMSSNGTILSGGTGLTGANNRTRIGWLTSGGTLEDATDYEFSLALDLAAGSWSAQINDDAAVTGTFNQEQIVGIDGYQAAFQQFSAEDYLDIDEISVSVIPEPATVGLLASMGGGLLWIRRRFIG